MGEPANGGAAACTVASVCCQAATLVSMWLGVWRVRDVACGSAKHMPDETSQAAWARTECDQMHRVPQHIQNTSRALSSCHRRQSPAALPMLLRLHGIPRQSMEHMECWGRRIGAQSTAAQQRMQSHTKEHRQRGEGNKKQIVGKAPHMPRPIRRPSPHAISCRVQRPSPASLPLLPHWLRPPARRARNLRSSQWAQSTSKKASIQQGQKQSAPVATTRPSAATCPITLPQAPMTGSPAAVAAPATPAGA